MKRPQSADKKSRKVAESQSHLHRHRRGDERRLRSRTCRTLNSPNLNHTRIRIRITVPARRIARPARLVLALRGVSSRADIERVGTAAGTFCAHQALPDIAQPGGNGIVTLGSGNRYLGHSLRVVVGVLRLTVRQWNFACNSIGIGVSQVLRFNSAQKSALERRRTRCGTRCRAATASEIAMECLSGKCHIGFWCEGAGAGGGHKI